MVRTYLGILAIAMSLTFATRSAMAVDYTWDGTGDGFTWTDPLNWNLDAGAPTTTADRALFTGAANVTAGFPQNIHFLSTGTGLVQLNGSLGFGPNVSPQGALIGSGGLVLNGSMTAGGGGSGVRDFASSGNVTINGTLAMLTSMPIQTAGTWDITTLLLPQASGNIGAWNFIDSANTTISTNSIASQTYTFTGQPNFVGGRPTWNMVNGGDGATGHNIQLGTFTLYGNTLTIDGWPGPPTTRHTELHSNGGTLDLNAFAVNGDNAGASFLDIDNGTILIQGTSGTVWNNQSAANTSFNIDNNTSTTIDPTGSGNTVSIDTSSVNAGTGGFSNNFAFGNLTLGGNDTYNLIGTAYTGGGNTALYVADTLTARDGAVLNLGGRSVFVDGALVIGNSPGDFTVNGGELFLTSNTTATFEINGPGAGTGYDQLVLTGTSTLHLNDAVLDIDFAAGSGLYFLVDNQSLNAIDGIFDGLAQGAQVLIGDPNQVLAFISYQGDAGSGSFLGGNDIVLQVLVVPEPSSFAVWSLAMAAVLPALRRFRKR